MSRKRGRQRRRSLLLIGAAVVSVLVLLFASDVSKAAHSVPTAQASQNASFASLGNALIGEENSIDSTLTSILVRGASLDRAQLYTKLLTLRDETLTIPAEAAQLRFPVITGEINEKLASSCQELVRAYDAILADVANGLSLPWPSPATLTIAQADADLATTTQAWSSLTGAPATQPGHVTLDAFSNFSGILNATAIVQQLSAAPHLKVARSVSIAAVAVTPSPFPAPHGQLDEPSTSTIALGVSVLNGAFALQPVTVSATLTAASGRSASRTYHLVLGPRGARAVTPISFAVVGGEHATLTVNVTGAPATPGGATQRTYQVIISPTVTSSQG
jgi:hypothetical protein